MPANTRPNKKAEDIFKNIMGDYKNVSKKITVKNPRAKNETQRQEFEEDLREGR